MAERVYLLPTYKFIVVAGHAVQHGIDTQAERMVIGKVFIIPSDGCFAVCAEDCDVPVNGIHPMLQMPDFQRFVFDFPYPVTLME